MKPRRKRIQPDETIYRGIILDYRAECERLTAWNEHGDLAAREDLAKAYMMIVKAVVFTRRRRYGVDVDEENSAGLEALTLLLDKKVLRPQASRVALHAYIATRIGWRLTDHHRHTTRQGKTLDSGLHHVGDDGILENIPDNDSPYDLLQQRRDMDIMREEREKLSPRYQEILKLVFDDGMDYEDIAARIKRKKGANPEESLSLDACYHLFFNARQALRERVRARLLDLAPTG